MWHGLPCQCSHHRSSTRMDLTVFYTVFRFLSLFCYRTDEIYNRLDYFLFIFHFGVVVGTIVVQIFFFNQIFEFDGNIVLMLLDIVQITLPIICHGVILLEAFFLRNHDAYIRKSITEMDQRLFTTKEERLLLYKKMLRKTGHHGFLMLAVTIVIPIVVAMRLYPDLVERGWAISILYKYWSNFVTKMYICMVVHFYTLIASRLQRMYQILQERKFEVNYGNLLKQTRRNVNDLWSIQELLVKRFSKSFVLIIGTHFCYVIVELFFTMRRIRLGKFQYVKESAITFIPNACTCLALLITSQVVYITVR